MIPFSTICTFFNGVLGFILGRCLYDFFHGNEEDRMFHAVICSVLIIVIIIISAIGYPYG